jgi:hypothetical protein
MTTHDLFQAAPSLPNRWSAGREVASLIAVPVLLIVLLVSFPPAVDSDVTDVASAESALDATLSHPLGTWFGFLVVAAIYLLLASALTPLVRRTIGRGALLVRIGHTLVVIGAIGLAIENAVVGIVLRTVTTGGVDHDAAVSVLLSLLREGGPASPLLWLALGLFIGPVFLVIGAIRSETTPWWHGLLAAAAVIGMIVTRPGVSGIGYLAVMVALAAVFIPVAWRSTER